MTPECMWEQALASGVGHMAFLVSTSLDPPLFWAKVVNGMLDASAEKTEVMPSLKSAPYITR